MAKKNKSKQASGMAAKAKRKAEKNMNRGKASYLYWPEEVEEFKPKDKTYNLDVVPYTISVTNHPEAEKGDHWYQRTIFVHFINGVGHLCRTTIGKTCPICEHVKELYNSEDNDDVEFAKNIKKKERELYNVIDLDDQDKGVMLFNHSYHLFGKALDEEINEADDEYGGFAELEGGKTLEIRFRKRTYNGNPYFEAAKINFEDRDDYDENILDDVIDLDEILAIESYDVLQKVLYGLGEEDEEEESNKDQESSEEKKSSKKSERKKSNGKKQTKKKSSSKNTKKNECPYGHKFGEDTDQYDDCEDCDNWTACSEANEDEDED